MTCFAVPPVTGCRLLSTHLSRCLAAGEVPGLGKGLEPSYLSIDTDARVVRIHNTLLSLSCSRCSLFYALRTSHAA